MSWWQDNPIKRAVQSIGSWISSKPMSNNDKEFHEAEQERRFNALFNNIDSDDRQNAENPLEAIARDEMNTLWETAVEAYYEQKFNRATDLWDKALAIAESINDVEVAVKIRSGQGEALKMAGKYKKALSVLTPNFLPENQIGEAEDIYNTLNSFIDIAIWLPIKLSAINKAIEQTYDYLRNCAHMEWRHKILHNESWLNVNCGTYNIALVKAQEALALYNAQHPLYIIDSHLDNLVNLSLCTGNIKLAQKYLSQWEEQVDATPHYRIIMINYRKSNLFRHQKDMRRAIEHARHSVMAANYSDSDIYIKYSANVFIRACLVSGDIFLGRNSLPMLIKHRHSESKHEVYNLWLLLGDLHLSTARSAAGMLIADDEFDKVFPLPNGVQNSKATIRELKRALFCYHRAFKLGKQIDELLECTLRQETLTKRYVRVADIKKLCEENRK